MRGSRATFIITGKRWGVPELLFLLQVSEEKKSNYEYFNLYLNSILFQMKYKENMDFPFKIKWGTYWTAHPVRDLTGCVEEGLVPSTMGSRAVGAFLK